MIGFNKRLAIKKYVFALPALLAKDYGKLDTYTAKQVLATLTRNQLSSKYKLYALAMYCPLHEYDSQSTLKKPDFTYETYRQEIADLYFDGDTNFKPPKIKSNDGNVGGTPGGASEGNFTGDNSDSGGGGGGDGG